MQNHAISAPTSVRYQMGKCPKCKKRHTIQYADRHAAITTQTCSALTRLCVSFFLQGLRGMRERSPPLPKIVHPSHPVWAIASFNKAKCNAESPPGGTAYLITVSSVPGKLSRSRSCWLIYSALTETVVVLSPPIHTSCICHVQKTMWNHKHATTLLMHLHIIPHHHIWKFDRNHFFWWLGYPRLYA